MWQGPNILQQGVRPNGAALMPWSCLAVPADPVVGGPSEETPPGVAPGPHRPTKRLFGWIGISGRKPRLGIQDGRIVKADEPSASRELWQGGYECVGLWRIAKIGIVPMRDAGPSGCPILPNGRGRAGALSALIPELCLDISLKQLGCVEIERQGWQRTSRTAGRGPRAESEVMPNDT